jgi:hypothetical protein
MDVWVLLRHRETDGDNRFDSGCAVSNNRAAGEEHEGINS